MSRKAPPAAMPAIAGTEGVCEVEDVAEDVAVAVGRDAEMKLIVLPVTGGGVPVAKTIDVSVRDDVVRVDVLSVTEVAREVLWAEAMASMARVLRRCRASGRHEDVL